MGTQPDIQIYSSVNKNNSFVTSGRRHFLTSIDLQLHCDVYIYKYSFLCFQVPGTPVTGTGSYLYKEIRIAFVEGSNGYHMAEQ